MNTKIYLLKSMLAAIEAGNAIIEIYQSDFEVEEKADRSPLTLADKRAHDIISRCLSEFDFPVLSEEGKDIPYEERRKWDTFWLVDPLDGTKEFIKRNGEFTVNIALIQDRKPIAGVVFVPDKGVLYFASSDCGAFKVDYRQTVGPLKAEIVDYSSRKPAAVFDRIASQSTRLPVYNSTRKTFTIIGSRSHATPELEAFVQEKRREHDDVEFISAGSSLKFCLVAEGKADIYPRLGPTMEWDTAAGQAIAESSGARVFQYETDEPLQYNKENLLNPWFVVVR